MASGLNVPFSLYAVSKGSFDCGQAPGREGSHAVTIIVVREGERTVIVAMPGVDRADDRQRQCQVLAKGDVIGGFAGATADAFTLFERLEVSWNNIPDNSPAPASSWPGFGVPYRAICARLEAMMLVADKETGLVLTGTGDVLEPEGTEAGSVMGIGSGGNYALAAARALLPLDLDAEAIARRALEIASEICVYTNRNVVIESLP